jgi:N-acetylmuramoyl-L-alanine amidase
MFQLLFPLLALLAPPATANESPAAREGMGRRLPPLAAPALSRPFRVVIDPGHGGNDHGTIHASGGGRVAEKDVTLTLARRVAAELRSLGMSVYLTRDADEEIDLGARTKLANRLRADAFLSIHMNSAHGGRGAGAEGIETFILNTASDASSRRLAHLENSVLGSAYDTSTPEATDVALILKDLRLDANLGESKKLACSVQNDLVAATGARRRHRDRGVKQALFHVLLGADMPSVLVEAGFLSSARDRANVLSARGQKVMSRALASAVERFRRSREQPALAHALARCKVN